MCLKQYFRVVGIPATVLSSVSTNIGILDIEINALENKELFNNRLKSKRFHILSTFINKKMFNTLSFFVFILLRTENFLFL